MRRFDARTRGWLALAAVLAALYAGGAVVSPWLESRGWAVGSWLRLAYAPVCHQESDRCLDIGSGPLAVCARCAGLYAGGLLALLAGSLAGLGWRPSLAVLVLVSAPTLLDFGASLAGLPSLENWPRFAAALAPGLAFGLLLADGIADISGHVGVPRRSRES